MKRFLGKHSRTRASITRAYTHAHDRTYATRPSEKILRGTTDSQEVEKRIGDEGTKRGEREGGIPSVHYLLKKARLPTTLYNCFR